MMKFENFAKNSRWMKNYKLVGKNKSSAIILVAFSLKLEILQSFSKYIQLKLIWVRKFHRFKRRFVFSSPISIKSRYVLENFPNLLIGWWSVLVLRWDDVFLHTKQACDENSWNEFNNQPRRYFYFLPVFRAEENALGNIQRLHWLK